GPVAVAPRATILGQNPRDSRTGNHVMRRHFARVVDQVIPDPLERLPGGAAPPVDGGVLDAVALAVVVGVLRRSRLLDHKIDRSGGGDASAAYRADRDHRGRGGITFSREAHRALSTRADLAV